ncbi:hypothetical protein SAMN05661091_1859 [Paenibacillus uliginis N3/975]|uniref:Uncharacterized protein n=1 Tax=Paenibacillus uliginis N3/975 TaxID=1313296 RepID=A0A1X7H6T0_9BACL|nr:DUF5696 domain-containing protein [Paenibacillus uliginis]SMF80635.1 hypothetical protein SAMN05661091_1859 [Paenibacillus uliginis N3/975]
MSNVTGWRRLAVLALLLVIMTVTACKSSPDGSVQPVGDDTRTKKVSLTPDTALKVLTAADQVKPQIPGLDPVLENDYLRLYISKETAEIAVLDKRSGQVWRSNPDSSGDKLASPYLKGKLSSQISFVYLTRNGQNKDYDSFNNSVKFKQFEIQVTEMNVTVTYQFGDPNKGLESVPLMVSKERFEERLLSRLDDPEDQEQLKIRYKFNESQNVYERREIPKAVVKKLLALFEKMEYTEDDLAIDNGEGGEGGAESETEGGNPKFSVALSYTLDGDHLVASVDTNTLKEETPPYRVHTLSLLENFGAAGKEDEGYIFLPDGSGTLIPLNSGRKLAQPIQMPVYGEDSAKYVKEKFNSIFPNRLPVFGMKKNDAAFLAVIEEGDGLAWLSADISGRLHEFNTVSSQFIILPKDEVRLSNNEIMHKTPRETYRGQLRIRYAFLNGDQANYAGMAGSYRSYLETAYGMKKIQGEGDTPFYLELIGSVPKMKNMLGFPYESLVPLTKLEQAEEIVDELYRNQIKNIRVNYKGWFNNGINHEFPSGIAMDSVIGSKEDWRQLVEKLQKNGGGFYPDTAFQHVYHPSGGFSPGKDSAQYISRRYAKIHEFDRAAYFRHTELLQYYLLSPRKLQETVDHFMTDYAKWNPGSLSLRDLGSELYSDFRRNGELTREQSKALITSELDKIYERVPDLMMNGGNAYALPYASHVLGVPEKSNEYQLAGESVPFNQMVLHGYVEYTGSPFNMADDQDVRVSILRSVETGANVYFSWFYGDPSALKDTRFSYLYSNQYKQWVQEAVSAYGEVNAVLKKVRGQAITGHEKLSERVYRTTYESGLQVIVNYRKEAVTVEGKTIQGNGYIVEGG